MDWVGKEQFCQHAERHIVQLEAVYAKLCVYVCILLRCQWVGLYGVTHMLAHIIINWCLNVCAFRVTYVCWCVVTELIRKAVLFELVWSLEVQELFPHEIAKRATTTLQPAILYIYILHVFLFRPSSLYHLQLKC